MKLVTIILSIAMMMQLSLAASVGRVKRDANLVNGITEVIAIYKRAFPITEAVTKDVLSKIPKTPAYRQYRDELGAYLDAVAEYKATEGPCVDKTFEIITKFDDAVESLNKDDSPAEAKIVFQMINGDARFKTLEKEMEAWSVKYQIDDIDETLKDINFEDAVLLVPIVLEQC